AQRPGERRLVGLGELVVGHLRVGHLLVHLAWAGGEVGRRQRRLVRHGVGRVGARRDARRPVRGQRDDRLLLGSRGVGGRRRGAGDLRGGGVPARGDVALDLALDLVRLARVPELVRIVEVLRRLPGHRVLDRLDEGGLVERTGLGGVHLLRVGRLALGLPVVRRGLGRGGGGGASARRGGVGGEGALLPRGRGGGRRNLGARRGSGAAGGRAARRTIAGHRWRGERGGTQVGRLARRAGDRRGRGKG